jgi:two-component system chemotaxis sensor kinase CheA
MTPEATKIDRWIEQLDAEIRNAQPGGDLGLLPIRELFANIRDRTPESGAFSGLHACAARATEVVEAVMDGDGNWTVGNLAELSKLLEAAREARLDPDYEFQSSAEPPSDIRDIDPLPESARVDRWIEQLACELVLAEPGTDNGLLPVRELFSNISEHSPKDGPYSGLHTAAAHATALVEAVMDRDGLWRAADLRSLEDLLQTVKQARKDPAFIPEFRVSKTVPAQPEVAPATPAAAAPEVEVLPEEDPLVVNLEDADLIKEFLTEAREHLTTIEQGILVLEETPDDHDTLNNIFRSFHTFKGTSGFLNLVPINRLSHELETLLDLARQKKLKITRTIIDLILEGGDNLKEQVNIVGEIASGNRAAEPVTVCVQPLIKRLKHAIEHPDEEPPAAPVQQEAAKIPATVASPTLPDASKNSAVAASPSTAPAPAATAAQPKKATRAPALQEGGVVKVDTHKLDSLVDLVGEMVIAQSQVMEDPELKRASSQRLSGNLAQLGRIVNELQRTAMSLRMVPIRGTFQKMGRLVRDLAQRVGKRVELKTEGEDTELDRNITEELADPLMHMIRNSVDHGIESPDKRTAAGKSPVGTVVLRAYHQGGSIVIEIQDDGAGLPKDRIFAKAVEKGIIPEDSQLSDQEIYQLIFAPGFSTAEQVTDISGRGVGMDVVRRNIEKLRGKIEIETERGQGTTFKIFLPLTLAIIDGLVLAVGDQRFIIPTLSVRESFRPTQDAITTVQESGEVINVRGSLVPVLRLYRHLGLQPKSENPLECIALVVESAHARRCILVDDLVGKQEVVIKSLGERVRHKALAGAAILGDGTVGLILEPHHLATLDKN